MAYINHIYLKMFPRDFSKVRAVLKRFQYVSDLHIDVNKNIRMKAIAPNLIIAGDIGRGWGLRETNWLAAICKDFDRVYFTPGNHDYYNTTDGDKLNDMRTIRHKMAVTESKIKNLRVLDGGMVEHNKTENAWLIGATLWSRIPEKFYKHYIDNFQCFRHMIITSDRVDGTSLLNVERFNPILYNHFHAGDKLILHQQFQNDSILADIKRNNSVPIVITHHAPLIQGCCLRKYHTDRLGSLNHAYCTDLSKKDPEDRDNNLLKNVVLMETASYLNPVWVFGHTHYRTTLRYTSKRLGTGHGVYLASNPLAFPKALKSDLGPKVPEKTLDQVISKHWDENGLIF